MTSISLISFSPKTLLCFRVRVTVRAKVGINGNYVFGQTYFRGPSKYRRSNLAGNSNLCFEVVKVWKRINRHMLKYIIKYSLQPLLQTNNKFATNKAFFYAHYTSTQATLS